jgi:hypothetical protein
LQTLRGQLLFSEASQVKLDAPVHAVHVAVDECGALLEKLSHLDRPLLLTTPSRIDVIATALSSHIAGSLPLSGIVIAEHDGTPSVHRLRLQAIFDGLERQQKQGSIRLPIFMTAKSVYETAQVCLNCLTGPRRFDDPFQGAE